MELVTTASALSITVVFFWWLVLHVGGNNGVRYFDDIVTAFAALSACVACLLAGRREAARSDTSGYCSAWLSGLGRSQK